MKRKIAVGALVAPLVLSGCATTPCAVESKTPGQERVSVRFTTSGESAQFAARFDAQPGVQLASHGSTNVVHDGKTLNDLNDGPNAFRAVMWGGDFNGNDVTHDSTALPPGQYMFGLFDEYNGAAYQGWLNVNAGDSDYLELLREWRDTVHAQKVWLGYDRKLDGQFASTDAAHFRGYARQIRTIKGLERKINDAIEAEKRDRARRMEQRGWLLGHTEVLLTPGAFDFSHPSTRPALTQDELARVSDGQALTKIITVADYKKATEKLRRVNDLRRELQRNRNVFEEEVKRLQRRKRYYTITDHLYKHDKAFVVNERRLQDAVGVVDRLDQQLESHRHRAYALAFVTGLFAPEVTEELFAQEEQDLRHDHIVLEERMRQLDLRFDRLAPDSSRRVNVESDRQKIAAAIDDLDKKIDRIDTARLAINTLRDSSGVIHRQGSASVLTASIFDGSIPAFVADAIERESLMTVRLQGGEQQSNFARSNTQRNTRTAKPATTVSSKPGSKVMGSPFGPTQSKSNRRSARKTSAPAPKPKRNTVSKVSVPAPKPARSTRKSSILVGEYPSAKRVEPVGGDASEGVLWDDCCIDTVASKPNAKRPTLASKVPPTSTRRNVEKVSAPASKPSRATQKSSILVGQYPSAQRVEPIGGDVNEGVLWDDCCVDKFTSAPTAKRKTLASKVAKPNSPKTVKKASTPASQPTESKIIYIEAHPEMLEEAPK